MISVTQALSIISQNYGPDEAVIETAAQRGTAVHLVCAAYALGLFPMVTEETEGYFQSFKNWFDAHVSRVAMEPEKELRDEKLGLVGHPDLIVELKNAELVLIDIKTPVAYRKTWSLQLAGYWHLVKKETGLTIIKPGVLMLDPNGRPAKVKWVEEEEKMGADHLFSLFCQVLNLCKFMNNGKGGGKLCE